MFVDFNTTFNNKPNSAVIIPNLVMENLSEKLPDGIPEQFDISIATEDGRYERKLTMHQEPYLSLDKMRFKSEDKQPLQLEVITSADNGGGTITANLRLKYADTIRDIVESIFIFNDIADGKAKLDRHTFQCGFSKGSIQKFNTKTAAFWEKVLQVEEYLGIHFMVPKGDTEYTEICDVEWLYRNLICNLPIRKNQRLASVSGAFGFNINDEGLKELENKGDLFFRYQTTCEMNLFGQKIKLPALCGMFNSAVKKIEKLNNGKVRIYFKDKGPNEPSYTSVLCFKDEDSLIMFEDEKRKDGSLEKALEDAKLVDEYLD